MTWQTANCISAKLLDSHRKLDQHLYHTLIAGPCVLMQVHSDNAGNVLSHVIHSPVACTLNEHYHHHLHECTHIKHLLPAKCDILIDNMTMYEHNYAITFIFKLPGISFSAEADLWLLQGSSVSS